MERKISRRNVLKGGAALAASASLITFNSAFGFSRVFGQEMKDDDAATVANLAATAELFAMTHYLAAVNSAKDLKFNDVVTNYMKAGFIAEADHYDLLTGALGAKPVVTEFYVPETLFKDAAVFAATTEVAEATFVAAYLAAVRIFSAAGNPALAVTAAQIAAVEAEHRLFVRQLAGKPTVSNNQSYAEFQFDNVSGAVPVLQPFLDGKAKGFVGPVKAPTADEIKKIRDEAKAIGYDGKGAPYAAMKKM
jgi:hypothetical protein